MQTKKRIEREIVDLKVSESECKIRADHEEHGPLKDKYKRDAERDKAARLALEWVLKDEE